MPHIYLNDDYDGASCGLCGAYTDGFGPPGLVHKPDCLVLIREQRANWCAGPWVFEAEGEVSKQSRPPSSFDPYAGMVPIHDDILCALPGAARTAVRAHGGKWHKVLKCWCVPKKYQERVEKLLAEFRALEQDGVDPDIWFDPWDCF